MSDDEADPELLQLLRQHLKGKRLDDDETRTGVLEDAEYIYNNSIDVAIVSQSTKAAARMIYEQMQKQQYSTKMWAAHELHPTAKDEQTVNFIFTLDLLNFSFWSENGEEARFGVDFRGQTWFGYYSLVAVLQRALEEGILITTSDFWQDQNECTDEVLKHVFRSSTSEEIPLLAERIACLREAGAVLYAKHNCSPLQMVQSAKRSASRLVNILARDFPCFNDVTRFENRRNLHIMKRAQIFVADLWAAFEGEGYGCFNDIDSITMFADYRIPQILNSIGCLWYAPSLERRIKDGVLIPAGHSLEAAASGVLSLSEEK